MPAKSPQPNLDQDNAWKDMLDRHFPEFIEFFFPEIYAAINWSRKPVFLDKELAKLGPKHLKGKRLADKLAKVWLKTGQPLFVVLHSEIQGQARPDFNERMYVYNYWLIRLPEELDQKLEIEIEEITEGKHMPYVTSWERIAEKRGRSIGRSEGRTEGKAEGRKIGVKESLLDTVVRQLKRKIGKLDDDIKLRLEKLSVARLKKLAEDLLDFSQPDDLERWLKRKTE